MTLESSSAGCHVRGAFRAPVTAAQAWGVLTDYDHISEFVRSMRSSRIERGGDGQLLVRQEAVAGALLLHHRVDVLLEIHEEPGRRIRFSDVLGKDFSTYAGEWRISADTSGTRVEYELEAEPRSAMARAFSHLMLRGTVSELLEQVRAEMLRRAAGGKMGLTPDPGSR